MSDIVIDSMKSTGKLLAIVFVILYVLNVASDVFIFHADFFYSLITASMWLMFASISLILYGAGLAIEKGWVSKIEK